MARLLTGSVRMVGNRWRRTLRFSSTRSAAARPGERAGPAPDHDYRALISASETIDGGAWPEVPERLGFEVTPELRLRITPLDES